MAIDWLKIRNEYIAGGGSYRALAEKYEVSLDTVKRRASAEGWKNERTKTAPKIHQKTVRKVVERTSDKAADRIVHLLSIGDRLAEKLERAANDLGEYYTVKRKTSHVEKDDDDKPVAVEETAEIAVQGPSAINGANLRQLAATLKDLRDVAQTGRTDEDDAALKKAHELLGGIGNGID